MRKMSRRSVRNKVNVDDSDGKNVKKRNEQKEVDLSDSSSESDIEDYLLPANKIDLGDLEKNKTPIKENERTKNEESDISPLAGFAKTPESKDVEPSSSFQSFHDYSKKLAEVKKQAELYKSSVTEEEDKSEIVKNEIENLLSMGEVKCEQNPDNSDSDEEEEDWQEIEDKESAPRRSIEITIDPFPDKKKKKKPDDVFASIKRRLNRMRKENQILIHRVHLLCWIGHGNYVNSVLNDRQILSHALALIPSKKSYPSGRIDLKYLEEILRWFRKEVPLVDREYKMGDDLREVLNEQIKGKKAYDKKMLVYIFIVILRSLGVRVRLVLSLLVEPVRPAASDLHFLGADSSKKKKIEESDEDTPSKKKIKTSENDAPKDEKPKKVPLPKASKKSNAKIKAESKTEPVKSSSRRNNSKKGSEEAERNASSDKKEKDNVEKKRASRSKPEIGTSKKVIKEKKQPEEDKNDKKKKDAVSKKSTKGSEVEKKSGRRNVAEKKEEEKAKSSRSTKSQKNEPKEEEKSARRRSGRKVPQVDGVDDSSSEEELNISKKRPRRSVKKPVKYVEGASDSDDAFQESPEKKFKYNIFESSESSLDLSGAETSDEETFEADPSEEESSGKEDDEDDIPRIGRKSKGKPNGKSKCNLKSLKKPPPAVSKISREEAVLKARNQVAARKSENKSSSNEKSFPLYSVDVKVDVMNLIKEEMARSKGSSKRISNKHLDSDDDFRPKEKVKTSRNKQREAISSDDEKKAVTKGKKRGNDVWLEVFLEDEEKWISVDVIFEKIHCVNELYSRATHPVSYVIGWDNSNHVKDVTARYCSNFNTATRKFRTEADWWNATLKPYRGPNDARNKEEDEELNRSQLEKPLPTTISEYKNHPLYVLQRHLLKFEAIYPPDAPTLGYVRGEAVFPRECVHELRSRDIWLKQARVVRPKEEPYKIVKGRPKYDRLSNKVIEGKMLEVFGEWQTGEYDPPTAEGGVIPRNAFGNVDLFKPCMLPKKTVHLQLPGLQKIAKRLNIDCASAIVGFDFHGGWSHPVYDGFVVCEEFADTLIAAWDMEQEELERKEKEKYEQRVYGNWKKLIKGLILKEKLKVKYGFGTTEAGSDTEKEEKTEAPKKKRAKK